MFNTFASKDSLSTNEAGDDGNGGVGGERRTGTHQKQKTKIRILAELKETDEVNNWLYGLAI